MNGYSIKKTISFNDILKFPDTDKCVMAVLMLKITLLILTFDETLENILTLFTNYKLVNY